MSERRDAAELEELKTALGAGGTGKGAVGAARGTAGVVKELEKRQKSRATRTERDVLDRALVDLSGFYRDVIAAVPRRTGGAAQSGRARRSRRRRPAVRSGRRAAAAGRDAGVPGGDRGQRQTADRDRGDDDAAAHRLSADRLGGCGDRGGAAYGAPMGMLCAVVFTRNGQLFYADPGELDLEVGDQVLLPDRQRPRHGHGGVAARVLRRGHRRVPACWPARRPPPTSEATEEMRKAKARTLVATRRLVRDARAADEGPRRRPAGGQDRRLLLLAGDRRLPLAAARPVLDAEGAGRAAPGHRPGRRPGHRRDRVLRAGHLLLDVPARLRADHPGDGPRPGPAAEPDADLRRLRPADVLPEVRAPDVRRTSRRPRRPSASASTRRSARASSSATTCSTTRWCSSSPPTAAPRSARRRRCAVPGRPTIRAPAGERAPGRLGRADQALRRLQAQRNPPGLGCAEPPWGIEPQTFSLRVRCSTD